MGNLEGELIIKIINKKSDIGDRHEGPHLKQWSAPPGWRPKGQAEDRSPGKVSHAEPHLWRHNVVASYL